MVNEDEMVRRLIAGCFAENAQYDAVIREAQETLQTSQAAKERNNRIIDVLVAKYPKVTEDQRLFPQNSPPGRFVVDLPESDAQAEPSPKKTRAEIFAEILKERGPMEIASMRAPARQKGYGVNMKDSVMYNSIYTSMSKHPELFERSGNTWSLKSGSGVTPPNGKLFGDD